VSTKDLKLLVLHFAEECNKGKAAAMAVIDETIATNYILHNGFGKDIHGVDDLKKIMSALYDAFPDSHTTIEDIIIEGDKAVIRYTNIGTHKGQYMGIPATNKKVTLSVIDINRIASGKIVEAWERFDTLGMMQQLGIIPTPGKK